MLAGDAAWGAADASTPKAAAKSLRAALTIGDADAIRQLLHVENDPDGKLVDAYAKLVLAGKQLADAAKQKFPGASDPFTQGAIAPEDAALIDAATESIEGDRATLTITARTQPMQLRRIDGAWKVLVSEEPSGATEKHRAEQMALITALAGAMTRVAEEIAADRYDDAAAAEAALKEQLGAVIAKAMRFDLPTSRPATTNQHP